MFAPQAPAWACKRKRNVKRKSPASCLAGLFREAPVDYRPWADIEKLKLSKVFSATRNHRFSSLRKAFRLS